MGSESVKMRAVLTVACLMAAATAPLRQATAQAAPATGTLTGIVFDSVAMAPLRGALIQLVRPDDAASARSVTADSVGRFSFTGVAAGAWLLGAQHARLDTLGVEQLARRVTIKARGTTTISLAIPKARTLIAQVCGEAVAADSSGYVHGTVRRANAERAGVPATVRVQWLEFVVSRQGVQRRTPGFEVETNDAGSFIACGVPVGAIVRLRAWSGSDSTGVLDVSLTAQGIDQRDLYVGAAQHVTNRVRFTPTDSADTTTTMSVTQLRGAGQLRGVVRGLGGQPVANARVTLRGTGTEVTTGADGAFVLRALPLGTHIVDVRAVGYSPRLDAVDVLPSVDPIVTVALERLVSLDTVRIRAMRAKVLGPGIVEFEQRRKSGMGQYLGPEDFEKLNPIWIADIFRNMPGVYVTSGMSGDEVSMRDGGQACRPAIYVNGMLALGDGNFENYVSLRQINAIEVYRRNTQAPPQYMQLDGCGSIVIWTGPRTVAGGAR